LPDAAHLFWIKTIFFGNDLPIYSKPGADQKKAVPFFGRHYGLPPYNHVSEGYRWQEDKKKGKDQVKLFHRDRK
jgi:hypothetical protein